MGRILLVLVLFVFLEFGCGTAQTQQIQIPQPQVTPTQAAIAANQKSGPIPPHQDFEKALPEKIREALENSDEFDILSADPTDASPRLAETYSIGGSPVYGNKLVRVTDFETKKRLLDAFYDDVRTAGWEAACFAPQHTIKVKYKNDFILIAICFHCGHYSGAVSKKSFQATPFMRFFGTIPNMQVSKSLPLFDEILSNQTK